MNRIPSSALSHLRIRHLKLIETLVDLGSLHKAAKALHMSQPAASAMLHEVENAFGTILFERTRKGVALNSHGKVAVARLHAVLGELEMLAQELQSTESLPVVRIGVLQHAFFGLLQSFLPAYLARVDCRVDLIDASATDLANRLQQNELDCLIGRMPAAWIDSFRNQGVFYKPLYDAEICVVGAASHPLARKRKVALNDLAKCTWILPREGSNSRYVLMAAFAAGGLPAPRVQIETSSFVFTLPLLPSSSSLTVAPRDPSLAHQRFGLVRILAIKLPQLLSPVAFVAQRSSMMNPNIRLLWEEIRKAKGLPNPPATD